MLEATTLRTWRQTNKTFTTFHTCHLERTRILKPTFTDGSIGTLWTSQCLWLSSVAVLNITWMSSVKRTFRRMPSLESVSLLVIRFGLLHHRWALFPSSLQALTMISSPNSATIAGIIWLWWLVSQVVPNTKSNSIRSQTMVQVCQSWRTMNNSRFNLSSLESADGRNSCLILLILSTLNFKLPTVL